MLIAKRLATVTKVGMPLPANFQGGLANGVVKEIV